MFQILTILKRIESECWNYRLSNRQQIVNRYQQTSINLLNSRFIIKTVTHFHLWTSFHTTSYCCFYRKYSFYPLVSMIQLDDSLTESSNWIMLTCRRKCLLLVNTYREVHKINSLLTNLDRKLFLICDSKMLFNPTLRIFNTIKG